LLHWTKAPLIEYDQMEVVSEAKLFRELVTCRVVALKEYSDQGDPKDLVCSSYGNFVDTSHKRKASAHWHRNLDESRRLGYSRRLMVFSRQMLTSKALLLPDFMPNAPNEAQFRADPPSLDWQIVGAFRATCSLAVGAAPPALPMRSISRAKLRNRKRGAADSDG